MTKPPAHVPIDWEEEEERVAAQSLAAGDPTGWFEQLYAAGESGRVTMPWNRAEPHPLLVEWSENRQLTGGGQRALAVGCGLGADAESITSRGFDTVGFDISDTAIRIARQRHPGTSVRYVAADLLDPPPQWRCGFDLVVEIITVQALPRPAPPTGDHQRQPPRRPRRNAARHRRRPRRRPPARRQPALAAAQRRDRSIHNRRTRHRTDRARPFRKNNEKRWRAELRRH
jgi:hypothetical protein